ncbi:hypothetical protein HRG84_16720 [Flavisolibacter sp. BT320]|nr:hypothetical protein [Flavisolibacter longurius]
MPAWVAIYIKQSALRKLVAILAKKQLSYYIPLMKTVQSFQGTEKQIASTLLASCVFVNTANMIGAELPNLTGIGQYLYWLDKPARFKDSEIKLLRAFLENYIISKLEWIPVENSGMARICEAATDSDSKRIKLVLPSFGMLLTANAPQAQVKHLSDKSLTPGSLRFAGKN